MCGQSRDEVTSEKRERRWPDTSELQNIDLVVVGVENETETASAIIQRIFDEGEHVPMKLENLDPPPWFDADKFKRGQYHFYSNFFAMFVTKLSGLLLVLSIPSVLKILIMTGKSSTPAKAFRRYMDTISNMLDWYSGDLRKKDTDIYKVLLTVRGKHCAAAKKAVTNGRGVISQKDLALTQFGFMGLAVMKKKVHGISGNTEDIEGFIHFWRTIGYFMGIEDRFNICSGSAMQVTEICEILVETFFKPLIQNPTEDFLKLSDALLAAMSPVIPLSHKDAFYEHMRRSLNFQPRKLPSVHARIMLSIQLFVHEILLAVWWLAFVWKPFLNVLLRLSLWANSQKYPLVAMLMFGKEVSKGRKHAVIETKS